MSKGIVLYIGGFELPDKNAAAHRVLANAKAIRDNGYEVVLVGVSRSIQKNESFEVQGFKSYNLRYPTTSVEWLSYLTSIKEVKKIISKEKIDTIICYNYQAVPLYRLMSYAKSNNLKIFGDCTEWYEPSGNPIFIALKSFDVNFRMKYLQSRLDGLIVISDYLENYYKKEGVKNCINIPPLVDLSEQKWLPLSLENKINENFNFIYSGSPGTGTKDRLDLIIESLKYFYTQEGRNLTFNIVGITKEYYVENFNKGNVLSSDYNFIQFHGRITHLESIKLLKEADYSIFFRENNLTNTAGFPTKFVESISAGTPVITNASSNVENYFSKENEFIGFLVRELNFQEIKSALQKALFLDKETVKGNKLKCFNSKLFNYRNYDEKFNSLLEFSIKK